jgi:hypothetical protein
MLGSAASVQAQIVVVRLTHRQPAAMPIAAGVPARVGSGRCRVSAAEVIDVMVVWHCAAVAAVAVLWTGINAHRAIALQA